jgi:hypothetical protein
MNILNLRMQKVYKEKILELIQYLDGKANIKWQTKPEGFADFSDEEIRAYNIGQIDAYEETIILLKNLLDFSE